MVLQSQRNGATPSKDRRIEGGLILKNDTGVQYTTSVEQLKEVHNIDSSCSRNKPYSYVSPRPNQGSHEVLLPPAFRLVLFRLFCTHLVEADRPGSLVGILAAF